MNESYQVAESSKKVLPSNDFSKFEMFLESYNLPSDNIIATASERSRMMSILPEFLNSLPDDVKKDARYLSKFVAGSAIGLFDAALNYVWNEVILNLRKKVIVYGLDYFFESAAGGTIREQYKTEDDLLLIKDIVLIDTCKKLELISDILHRKLAHILDMRNQIGASHPNEYSINAFELLGWLQDCIDGVLKENISDSAITIKQIIDNAKKNEDLISKENLEHFENSIKQLSSNMVSNLLNSLFGIFVSPNTTSKITKENILNLAIITWKYTDDDARYDLGKKLDIYKANLDQYKTQMAELFFQKCNGQKYYTEDAKIIKITLLCEQLENARTSWDNFIYEAPIAKEIMNYIKDFDDIPQIRLQNIISLFLKCRIGKNCSYNNGISQAAKLYYDKFFKLLTEDAIKVVIKILSKKEMECFLIGEYRKTNIIEICNLMNSEMLSDRLQEILNYIISFKSSFENVFKDTKFKQLSREII